LCLEHRKGAVNMCCVLYTEHVLCAVHRT
jgi:hypothetical protein